jgi:hypothetical protein
VVLAGVVVLGSLFNILLFRCRHRRTTFPLTPARKTGGGPAQTYVVCLDCGKQFTYDWKSMERGERVDLSADSPEVQPKAARSKLRYVAWISAVPVAWLAVNAAVKARKRSRSDREL